MWKWFEQLQFNDYKIIHSYLNSFEFFSSFQFNLILKLNTPLNHNKKRTYLIHRWIISSVNQHILHKTDKFYWLQLHLLESKVFRWALCPGFQFDVKSQQNIIGSENVVMCNVDFYVQEPCQEAFKILCYSMLSVFIHKHYEDIVLSKFSFSRGIKPVFHHKYERLWLWLNISLP